MATPSAILSIVVDANTAEATSKLTQYQRQLDKAEVASRRGIQARLGGSFNDEAFKKYQAATANAARKAADRRAFKAELGANFSPTGFRAYQREVDKTGKATQKAEGHVGRLTESFGKLGAAVVGVGAAFVSYEAAKDAIKDTIELTAATIKLSAITGLDAKEASKWIEIMKVRGVATTAVSMGFITLAKNIKTSEDATKKQGASVAALQQKQNDQIRTLEATKTSHQKLAAVEKTQGDLLDAARGKTDKATAAFKELGVTQAALTSGNLNEVLLESADGLSKVENPARRAALAQQLFGRSAKALIPILAEGRQGVEDALAAAERYGAFLPKNAAELRKAHEAQLQLNLAADGLKIAFTQVALPAIVKVAGGVLKFVQQMRDGKGAGGEFASAIKNAFTVVKNAVHFAVDELGGLKTAIEVLVGGYAVSRILKFAGALGGIAGGARGAAGVASGVTGAAAARSARVEQLRVIAEGGTPEPLAAGGAAGLLSKAGGVLSKASAFALLLPVGIAFSAVLDNWMNKNAESEGKKFADKFLAPMPDAIKKHFAQPLADAQSSVTTRQSIAPVNRQLAASGPGLVQRAAQRTLAASTAANAAQVRAEYFKIGQEAGQATVAGLRSVHDVSAPILLQDFLGRLRQLPAQARPEAAKAMISFAAELQAQGKLPVRELRMIMHNLEAQIPGFSAYLQQQGLASDQALAKALHFNTATSTLRNTLGGYRQQFRDWSISTKITGSNIVQNMTTAMDHLHQTVKSSSGQTRRDAVADIKKLHDQATALFSSMADKTAQSAKDMRGAITSNTSQAAKTTASNMSGLANAVYGGVRSGAINAKQGAKYIEQALNATLKAFGATPIPAATLKEVALSTPFGPNVGAFPKTGVGGGGKPAGAARGGLMQIGRYGQAGRDSVPLNVGGMPVMVAPGEQVAVFNRHQLPIVNQALAPMGGLPGLFSKVRTPNYMAQGGTVGGPNLYGHPGNISSGVRSLIGTMESRFPGLIVTATTDGGHAAGSYHYHGEAVDMASDAATMLAAASYVQTSGLYRSLIEGIHNPNLSVHAGQFVSPSFWGSSTWAQHANHIHLAILGALSGGGGGFGQISAPKVKGGGTIGNLLRAGFGKVANAANAYLGSHTGGGDSGSFGLPAGVGTSNAANRALGRQMMLGSFPASQWQYLNALWNKESGWSSSARNPQSGAAGIPQDITGNFHGGAAGQIAWGLNYIKNRYGSPSAAWAHEQKFNWYKHGGLLPFAGSFADGGVVPGPQGKAALAMVHGGEGIVPAFARGGGIVGRALQAHPNWLPPNAQKAIANALASALVASLGGIPSQGIAGQIQLQGFQNQVQAGQNAGNVGGQRAGLARILNLEQGWLSADRQQLKRINGALRKRGLSKKQRGQLLQDKLALLQEIGTVEADIGSTQTSLNDLSATTDTTGVSGVTDTTAVDAQNALAAAIAAQTQALTDATAAINAQTVYMKLVGEVEKQQAIKALADVISGQIGGSYYSRATGSAGDGSVARY